VDPPAKRGRDPNGSRGAVRRRYWPANMWQQIGGWFVTHGISISEDNISN